MSKSTLICLPGSHGKDFLERRISGHRSLLCGIINYVKVSQVVLHLTAT